MRQSNIELCRIVAMMLVLTVHSSFATFGGPADWNEIHYGLIVAQSFGVVGVNVFVLISGYFSIKLKKQSVLRLLWCCMFYGIIISLFSYFNHSFSIKYLFFLSGANWFIAAYLGLMCLSPILNVFVENCGKTTLGMTIIMLLLFQTWYEFIPKLIPDFHAGYSILSFCILYLMARYLRLYPVRETFRKKGLIFYLIITLVLVLLSITICLVNIKVDYLCGSIFKYNQPLVILSSICLFLFFTSLHIPSSKSINHIAKSCLAVLLIHTSISFFPFFANTFKFIYYHISGIILALVWILTIISVFILCALIDQMRLFIEKYFIPKLSFRR